MVLNKQNGMILPFMLLFLALITLVSGRIYSLGEQQRSAVRTQVQRSQANTLLLSAEDIVLRKLPLIDIRLFQRLHGEKENASLVFTLPLPDGDIRIEVTSAQQCINLAPLWEDQQKEKQLTVQLWQRLLARYHQPEAGIPPIPGELVIPQVVKKWVCYLPGAGQHWDITHLQVEHAPLLAVLLTDKSEQQLKTMLEQGFSDAQIDLINKQLGSDIMVQESHYYWLTITSENENKLYARSLINIHNRRGYIIRRRLLDDNAL